MAGMVRFEGLIEDMARQAEQQRQAITVGMMDDAAKNVVGQGGYCDQKVFMTAFWGHDVSPAQEYVNRMVTERRINQQEELAHIPPAASRLFNLVAELSLIMGQPFAFNGVEAGYSSLRLAMSDQSNLAINNMRYMIEPNKSIDPTNPTSFLGTVSMLALSLPTKNQRGGVQVSRLTLAHVRRDFQAQEAEVIGMPTSKICGTSNVRAYFASTPLFTSDQALDSHLSQLWQAAEKHSGSLTTTP